MFKYFFSLVLFIFMYIGFSFGLTGNNKLVNNNCSGLNLEISSPELIKTNFPVSFSLSNLTGNYEVDWVVYRLGKRYYSYKGNVLKYSFLKDGDVFIEADVKTSTCNVKIKRNIYVYKKVIITILDKDQENSFVSTLNLKSKGILLRNVSANLLEGNFYLLQVADYIIISQNNVIKFFSILPKNRNYIDKKFILLIDSFKGFFSKLIIPYVKGVYENNIYIYSSNDFLNILGDIYQGKELEKTKLLTTSSIGDKFYFPISYFVNNLILAGVDVNIIAIVLLALLGTIIVAFFRQIIGFSVFGVYTPLIFSIMYIIIGFKFLILLFVLALISQVITYFITKKVYILYASKISLTYIIYVIISIFTIGILIKIGFISTFHVDNSLILAYFVMPLLSKNLIKEETSILSKSFWIFVIEFIFIVSILLAIFNIDFIKYLLVAYPDLLWLFMLTTIFIGRFTGLQLLEYIRFSPLIKKSLHEEE